MTATAAEVPEPPAPAFQNIGEISALWTYIAARPHARVLEIGSLYGGTLWWWSHLPAIEVLAALDMPSDNPRVAEGVREARRHWHEWFSERVEFWDCSADSRSTFAMKWALDHGPYDFAFIDGDHSYDGVKYDWLAYSTMVRPGGIVAFHDTWPNYDRHEPGVVRWVDELRRHLPSIQWTDPDGAGICAFTMPG